MWHICMHLAYYYYCFYRTDILSLCIAETQSRKYAPYISDTKVKLLYKGKTKRKQNDVVVLYSRIIAMCPLPPISTVCIPGTKLLRESDCFCLTPKLTARPVTLNLVIHRAIVVISGVISRRYRQEKPRKLLLTLLKPLSKPRSMFVIGKFTNFYRGLVGG